MPKHKSNGTLKPSTTWSSGIDRTTKMYYGGKQARPDGGYSMVINGVNGNYIGEISKGNRKDIRNAVEAAHSCT